MNCNISVSPQFLKELKRLSKRYQSIKEDVRTLCISLQDNPLQGTDLGKGLRKVRMSIASKSKGKSGGARVITYTVILANIASEVKLLTIYDKSECENISDKELQNLIRKYITD